jgi:hypothetical protein
VRDLVLLDIVPGPIDDRLSASRRVLEVLLRAPAEAPDRRTLRGFLVDGGLSPGAADWLAMNVRLEDGRARWTFDRQASIACRRASAPTICGAWSRRARCRCGHRGGVGSGLTCGRRTRAPRGRGAPLDTSRPPGTSWHVEALEPSSALLSS